MKMTRITGAGGAIAGAAFAISLALPGVASAALPPPRILAAFDFQDAPLGAKAANASYLGQFVTSATWGGGGSGIALVSFGGPVASLCQDFGPNYPVMTFTTTKDFYFSHLNFHASGNHNFYQNYTVSIYLDGGATPVASYVATNTQSTNDYSFQLPHLKAGTHTISWNTNIDTISDYFALFWVSVTSP